MAATKSDPTIGLVVPFATDEVPFEGPIMYPGVRFIPRGVGVRALTPEGYDPAWNGILPAADYLAAQGVDAIMVIGTSLTFYRGPQAHDRLLEELRRRTGLPVSTMSQAILDGLREVGAKRVAVATAYTDVVNRRLKELLAAAGIDVLSLECFDLLEFGGPSKKSEADIIALSDSAVAKANADAAENAEAILISCGGLRTLGVAQPLEASHGIPVVSSATAAFWAAMRLIGESGRLSGYGRLVRTGARASALAVSGPLRLPRFIHIERAMKARVTVTLKSGILDPQGKAIEGALKSLGVGGVASVRQGKVFDIEIEGADRAGAETALKNAAEKLLANTVIENYRIEVTG